MKACTLFCVCFGIIAHVAFGVAGNSGSNSNSGETQKRRPTTTKETSSSVNNNDGVSFATVFPWTQGLRISSLPFVFLQKVCENNNKQPNAYTATLFTCRFCEI